MSSKELQIPLRTVYEKEKVQVKPKQFYGKLNLTMVTVCLLGIGTILRGVGGLLGPGDEEQMKAIQIVILVFLASTIVFVVISIVAHLVKALKRRIGRLVKKNWVIM
ncbi:MAG: hypothetical protein MHMPM18_003696 [Marteilia pararefringens]